MDGVEEDVTPPPSYGARETIVVGNTEDALVGLIDVFDEEILLGNDDGVEEGFGDGMIESLNVGLIDGNGEGRLV